MKHVLLTIALLTPAWAAAYPNPNVSLAVDAGDLVDSLLSQPRSAPLILADSASK